MKKPKPLKFFEKFRHKYRFVVLREDSLEERSSFSLSRFNVTMIVSSFTLILLIFVVLLISFTRLREYIPGYGDFKTKEIVTDQIMRADSLEAKLKSTELYLENIKRILSGDMADISKDAYKKVDTSIQNIPEKQAPPAFEDSSFISDMEQEDLSNVVYEEGAINDNALKNIVFYPPLEGVVTQEFDYKNHPAIDIAAAEHVGIKSVLDGTVVYSDWNVNTGYSIIIQHANNLLSVYSHNSVLLKKSGNFVHAGDVIAIIGETGELSNGAHLHFELWYNGKAVNPDNYIVF